MLEGVNYRNDGVRGTFTVPFHEEKVRFRTFECSIYNSDPIWLVRAKHSGIVFLTSLVTLIRVVNSLTKSIFYPTANVFLQFDGGELYQESADAHAYEALRAMGYGCVLTYWAARGILDPDLGRYHYGNTERKLNRHVDHAHRDRYYLAYCFQPIERLNEEKALTEANVQKITRYLEKLKTFKTHGLALRWAVITCACRQALQELSSLMHTAKFLNHASSTL